MNKQIKALMIGVFGMAVALPSLSASIIGDGGTSVPDVFNTAAGYTLLANTGLVNVNPLPGTSFNATYTEYVVRDASNMLCGVSGQCLTFLIDVNNSGPGVIERVSTGAFDSFITDVGYNLQPHSGIAPATVDRSANGNVIGFNFNTGDTNIAAGQQSRLLEIQTNSVYYTSGTVSIQDGVAGFGAGYAPSSVAPEPMSLLLFGSGLVGLGFCRKGMIRKRS